VLFGRRLAQRRSVPTGDLLPRDIVARMGTFGRFEFDPQGSGIDSRTVWEDIIAPLALNAKDHPAEFLRQLAAAVLPVGGWAVYGGAHLVTELFSAEYRDHSYEAMMAAALDFLRSLGVPALATNGYEWSFWQRTKGRTEPWLPARPVPNESDAPISPLRPGEVRRVVQLDSTHRSNVVLVRQEPGGGFVAEVDARYSDEDRRRARSEFCTAPSIRALYLELGRRLQVPHYWVDRELEPYFPYPKPAIEWPPVGA
jgi:hypothetical protein